jgi:hypothetical protein
MLGTLMFAFQACGQTGKGGVDLNQSHLRLAFFGGTGCT